MLDEQFCSGADEPQRPRQESPGCKASASCTHLMLIDVIYRFSRNSKGSDRIFIAHSGSSATNGQVAGISPSTNPIALNASNIPNDIASQVRT